MTNLRILALTSCIEKVILRRLLENNFIIDFVFNLQKLEEVVSMKHYDILLIARHQTELSQQFEYLRSQHRGLLVLLISSNDVDRWRIQAKNTNTLLLVKPVRAELLLQHLEQYAVCSCLTNDPLSYQDKLPNQNELTRSLFDQRNLVLSNLEKRCLKFLLDAHENRIHKLCLQNHLFGESGYLFDARLNSCCHRLRKKLSVCTPKFILRREYNGFLEIATCES